MKRNMLIVVKLAAAALILYLFGRHVASLSQDWTNLEQSAGVSSLHLCWLGVAGLAYLSAQLCFAYFWYRLLLDLQVSVTKLDALSAYSVGTMGKYVPGKALVIVLRTFLLPKNHVGRTAVALSVVYETLTMTACGAILATACLLWDEPTQWVIWTASGAGAVILMIVLHPVVFGVLTRFATLPLPRHDIGELPARCFQTVRHWAAISAAGWVFEGLSFWAMLRAVGTGATGFAGISFAIGVAAFATLLGFVTVFMPAGIGVRELAIIHLLSPICGRSVAILVSLVVRFIWTIVEGFLGGLLFGAAAISRRRRSARPLAVPSSPTADIARISTSAIGTPNGLTPLNNEVFRNADEDQTAT